MNVRLESPLAIILGHPEDVRLRNPGDGQRRSLRDILRTLKGDALGMSWDQDLLTGNTQTNTVSKAADLKTLSWQPLQGSLLINTKTCISNSSIEVLIFFKRMKL